MIFFFSYCAISSFNLASAFLLLPFLLLYLGLCQFVFYHRRQLVLGNLFEQCDKESIIGSVILRLIEMGCLIPLVKEKNRINEISKKTVDIQLVKPPLQGNAFDKSLYSILE